MGLWDEFQRLREGISRFNPKIDTQSAPKVPEWLTRFQDAAAETLNPINALKAIPAMIPFTEANQQATAARALRRGEHPILSVLEETPIFGQGVNPGLRIASGDVAGGLGEAVGNIVGQVAPFSFPGAGGVGMAAALKPLKSGGVRMGHLLNAGKRVEDIIANTPTLKTMERNLAKGLADSNADWGGLPQVIEAFNNDPNAAERFSRYIGANSATTDWDTNFAEAVGVQRRSLDDDFRPGQWTLENATDFGISAPDSKFRNLNKAELGEPLGSFGTGEQGKVESLSQLGMGRTHEPSIWMPDTNLWIPGRSTMPLDKWHFRGMGAGEASADEMIPGLRAFLKEHYGKAPKGKGPIYGIGADIVSRSLEKIMPGRSTDLFPPYWEGTRMFGGEDPSSGLLSAMRQYKLDLPGAMFSKDALDDALGIMPGVGKMKNAARPLSLNIGAPERGLMMGVDDAARNVDNGAVIQDILKARDAGGGGFTFNQGRGDMAGSDMYAVAIDPRRTAKLSGAANEDEILAFLEKNKALLNHPDLNIGGWVPTEGPGALDVSYLTPDRTLAEELGRLLDQTAIGHLSKEGYQEIPTGGTGGDLADIEKAYDLLPPELQKVLGHKNFQTPYGKVGPEFLGPDSTFSNPENVKYKMDELRSQAKKMGGPVGEGLQVALSPPMAETLDKRIAELAQSNPEIDLSGLGKFGTGAENDAATSWAHVNKFTFNPPTKNPTLLHGGAWAPKVSPMLNARGEMYFNPNLKTPEATQFVARHERGHVDDDIVKRFLASQRGEADPTRQSEIPLLKDFDAELKLYNEANDTPTERNVRIGQELENIQPPAMPPDVLRREAERRADDPVRFRYQLEDMVLGDLKGEDAVKQRQRMTSDLIQENPDLWAADMKLSLNPYHPNPMLQIHDTPVPLKNRTMQDVVETPSWLQPQTGGSMEDVLRMLQGFNLNVPTSRFKK